MPWIRSLPVLLVCACDGRSALQFEASAPGIPSVAGVARYEDRDGDRIPGVGDVLIVPFSRNVVLHGASVADFSLPTKGDSFGSGATLTSGPAADEVTITLGPGASLKTRQTFDSLRGDSDPSSGIDLQAVLAPDAIENPVDGSDAVATRPIDVVPGFVDSGLRMGNDPTQAVALGDLDGDGDLDLAEGNRGRTLWLRFNDGSGGFPPEDVESLGTAPVQALLLVDVDEDGDLDLLVGNAGGVADEVWHNDGTGFLQLVQVFGSSDTRALAGGDMDGDGDPDLLVANGAGPNTLWENREGRFVLRESLSDESSCPETPTEPAGCPTWDVGLADLDRNGELDVLEGNLGTPDLVRLQEQGAFPEPTPLVLEGSTTTSLALGDVDLDGDPDLVTGDARGPNRVWIDIGGVLVDSGQRLGSQETSDVVLLDVDQDGAIDLLEGVRGGGNRFWLNDHAGRFVDSGQALGRAQTLAIAAGDLDRDGDVDLVAGNEDGANAVWQQSLAGTWGGVTLVPSATPVFDTAGGWQVTAMDLDGDADIDLVVAGRSTSGSEIWLNRGSGVFIRAQVLGPDIDARSFAAADVDGDGAPDLIEARWGDTTMAAPKPDRIWLNDGKAGFALSEDVSLDNDYDSRAVALVDLDDDGDVDYVLTDSLGSRTQCLDCGPRVFRNEEGVFVDSGQNLDGGDTTPPGVTGLAIGDVDGNGLPDLVVTGAPHARLGAQAWLNGIGSSPGIFAAGWSTTAVTSFLDPVQLALGDVDRDGDLDLVSTDRDDGDSTFGNRVWINDGAGSFVDSGERLGVPDTPTDYASLVLADLDGDGDLDVVAGGDTGLHAVFANDGRGGFAPGTVIARGTTGYALRLAAADLDQDGDLDVLAAIDFGVTAEIWLNR